MSKRLKISGMLLLAGILVVALAVVAFRQWANHPADGAVHVGAPATIPAASEAPKGPSSVQTDYFTVQLPAGFDVTRQGVTPEGPTLVQLVASNEHQQLAITVANLPPEGLAGTGSYNLRVTNTDDYHPYRPDGMPAGTTAFRALSGPPAFAAFWPSGSLYAQIALTSDGDVTLSDLFNSFVQTTHTWEWK